MTNMWMDGWMTDDRWMNRWIWIDGQMMHMMDGWMDKWSDGEQITH